MSDGRGEMMSDKEREAALEAIERERREGRERLQKQFAEIFSAVEDVRTLAERGARRERFMQRLMRWLDY